MQSRAASGAILTALVVTAIGFGTGSNAAPATTLVTLGGGFLNGFEMPKKDTIPAMLAARLNAGGHNVTVQRITQLSTDDALRWLKGGVGQSLLASPKGLAVVVELGPFDCAPDNTDDKSLEHTRSNLDQLLGAFAAKDIAVLVVGTEALSWCPEDYDRGAYQQMFVDLAGKYHDALYPRFMSGIDGNPDLIKGNGIDDPNAKGNAVIADLMFPSVDALVTRAEGTRAQ